MGDALIAVSKTRTLAFALLVVGVIIVLGGCEKRGTAVLAEIWTDGDAVNASPRPQLLAPGEKPFVAPIFARTVIALMPGIYARLAPSSELTIRDLAIEKDGNETAPGAMTLRNAVLQLSTGELCAYLPADEYGGNSRIIIRVSGVEISAEQDSLFLVRVTPAAVSITCARGALAIELAGEQRTLAAGDYVVVPRNSRREPIRSTNAAENSAAQNDLEVALGDESVIRELVRAHMSLPAPWSRR